MKEAPAAARAVAVQPKSPAPTGRPWWPWLKRGVTLAFFALVAWLLIGQARTIEWGKDEILASLVAYRLVYYVAPLVIAAGVYLLMESRAKYKKLPT